MEFPTIRSLADHLPTDPLPSSSRESYQMPYGRAKPSVNSHGSTGVFTRPHITSSTYTLPDSSGFVTVSTEDPYSNNGGSGYKRRDSEMITDSGTSFGDYSAYGSKGSYQIVDPDERDEGGIEGDAYVEPTRQIFSRRPSQQAQWHARHASQPNSNPSRSTSGSSSPSPYSPSYQAGVGLGISSYPTSQLPLTSAPSQPEPSASSDTPWSPTYRQSSSSSHDEQSGVEKSFDSDEESEGDTTDSHYGWNPEGAAVTMIEDGRGKIVTGDSLDMHRSQQLALDLIGVTHLILPQTPTPELVVPFLDTVIPSLCASLVVLDISSCNLTSLPIDLCTLYSLEELDVSNNPLRTLPPSLSELHSLRVLSANGIGCSSLPPSFANLQKLHTLCLRRNRMLSLPSWLGLLTNIETLLVEDNPFHGTWKPLIEQMLIQWSPGQKPEHPAQPSSHGSSPRSTNTSQLAIASAHQDQFFPDEEYEAMTVPPVLQPPPVLQSYPSFGSVSSSSSSTGSPFRLRANTLFQSNYTSSPMQPSISEVLAPGPDPPRAPIRRMRSAGALVSLAASSLKQSPVQAQVETVPGGTEDGPVALPPPRPIPKRFVSLGREGARAAHNSSRGANPSDHSLEGTLVEESEPQSRPPSIDALGKEKGKWGFLKKMSIGRIRSGSVTGSAVRPNGPIHANTSSILGDSARLRPMSARNNSSLSYASVSSAASSDPNSRSSSRTQQLGPGSASNATLTSRQNKRRSYLPLDGPPSLNISIPSTSPFMSTTLFSNVSSPSASNRNRKLDDGSSVIDSYIQSSENSSTSDFDHSPTSDQFSVEGHRRTQYAAGLHSLLGYLRDLNDLCLPPIVPSAESAASGIDISGQFSPSTATSLLSQTSSTRASSNRRPTIGSIDMRRECSESSFNFSQNGSDPRLSGVETTHSDESKGEGDGQRKFKDDKVKRSRVVREIYETERTYVQGLRDLVEIYVKPSEAPAVGNSKDTVIPLQERKIVFGGLSGLLQFHEATFLPKLEVAAAPILKGGEDQDGSLSMDAALGVADVFRVYNPFMRMYSTYINNFPNALQRSSMWMLSSSAPMPSPSLGSPSSSSVHVATMGLTMSAGTPPVTPDPSSSPASLSLTTNQRKRIKAFIKRAKLNPKHTQISLDAYLLLPVQRIPRYRMLLNDLMKCTPPRQDQVNDVLEDAFKEMASLASCMNEEKRDAESRQKLVYWQSRIRGRFPSPLVQPHRKLLLDGPLTLIRLVKKNSELAEVVNPIFEDGEKTITANKSLVKVECLGDPDTSVFHLVGVLTSDLFVLCKKDGNSDASFELFAVLRMQTKSQPASVISGSTIRVVDNRAILYFEAQSPSDALNWVNMLNVSFQVTR